MIAAALLPLKRYADFRGRSTRTELVCFWLLTIPLGLLTLLLDHRAAGIADLVLTAALTCPLAALGVRRLHDQGRSGRWLLLALPGVAWSLWEDIHRAQGRDPAAPDVPASLLIAAALGALAVLILMILPPQSGANRFGGDPRDDPSVPTERAVGRSR